MHDDDLTILAHAATMLPVRPIEKAHREAINRKGHFRRTKHGELVWVEPHQVLAHIAELLPTVIAKGRLTEYYVTSATIIHDGVKVHLARITKTKENPGHAWVVSGYEIIRPVKS